MNFEPGKLYHVYNQGNNRGKLFYNSENYLFFIGKMKRHLLSHCDLLCWCLMPNHFHWIVRVKDCYRIEQNAMSSKNAPKVAPLNRSIATILSSYTQAMNRSLKQSGSMFRSRTKAKLLNPDENFDESYPITCFFYIHQNPLKAGLSKKPEDWPFSSYRDFAGFRKGKLCNVQLATELLNLPADSEKFRELSCKAIPGWFEL